MNSDEIEQLYQSVANNNLALLNKLIENGIDIHHDNDKAFLIACGYGHFRIVEFLLNQGADINTNSDFYDPADNYSLYGNALSLATGNNNWVVFDYLLEKDIKVDLNKSIALKHVVEYNDIGRTKELINRGASVNDSDSLVTAITNSHWDMAKYLINEENADIYTKQDLALRYSCYKGNLDIIDFLIGKGANINAVAIVKENTEEYHFNYASLTSAIASENWEVFHYLISKGADPNINNQEPFLYACGLSPHIVKLKPFLEHYIEKEYVIFNIEIFESIVKTNNLELLKFFLSEYPKVDIDKKILLQHKFIYEYKNTGAFQYLLNEGYEITQLTRDMLNEEKKEEFLKILLNYDLNNNLSINSKLTKRVKV